MCLGFGSLACSRRGSCALAAFFCLLWNLERPPNPSHHCHPRIPHPSLPGLPSLPRPHHSSLAPHKLLWQLIISWHEAERRRLQPPAQPPTGPTRSPPSHLGLKLALQGATRRKCKANSFFLSRLHLSVPLPLSCSVLLSLSPPSDLSCTPSPFPEGSDLKRLFYLSTPERLFTGGSHQLVYIAFYGLLGWIEFTGRGWSHSNYDFIKIYRLPMSILTSDLEEEEQLRIKRAKGIISHCVDFTAPAFFSSRCHTCVLDVERVNVLTDVRTRGCP